MKKIIKYATFTLLMAGCISCNNNNRNKESAETAIDAEYWTWPDSVESVFKIPDSISERMMNDSSFVITDYWSPQQKELASLVMNTFIDNVEAVNDDSLAFALDREAFVAKGIPEAYYDQILHDIKGLNSLKENGFDFGEKKLAQWWEDDKEKFRKELFMY